MKTLIKSIAGSVSFFSLLFPALALADLTSKDLLENCQVKVKLNAAKPNEAVNPGDAFQAGACTGYIKGFDDMEIIYASILAGPSSNEKDVKKYSLYCLPSGTTNDQMTNIFIKYLQAHPKEMGEDASLTMARALREAFPCPK